MKTNNIQLKLKFFTFRINIAWEIFLILNKSNFYKIINECYVKYIDTLFRGKSAGIQCNMRQE